MKMAGEELIAIPRQQVWDGLNDPEVLKACIPGCLDLVANGENGYEATVQAKIGPVKAKFSGVVTLSNVDAPNSYTITGEGKGGAAGFAKGAADVSLSETEGGTLLRYEVDAKVGGKLAQIGSRLVDASAKKLAGDFFATFTEEVKKRAPDENMAAQPNPAMAAPKAIENEPDRASEETMHAMPHPAPIPQSPMPAPGINPAVWVIGLVAVATVLVYAFYQ
ncbi:SRPBCC family protein [Aestuariispira insulae]|uniref:Carbon monoxide dehydrogenase subunit G n=1 Tax=Aestuariispira insulae TaxID=1461337 RepID=A0A3D9HPY9_9PROT|nr:carbon monoxide dehydrogenase subunit G [Aestuariispira insulae]RED50976.1 hypothetical protein DFP90_104249 [Aestuariispira insulae]